MKLDLDWLHSLDIVDWGYTEQLEATSFDQFHKWIEQGSHGELNYLADHRKDLRKTLKASYPEAQSALVFLFDYFPARESLRHFYQSSNSNGLKIASYVFGFEGADYHRILAERLNLILQKCKTDSPHLEGKLALDIHPVLDRDLALRSGLGWFGKNSMLIHRKHGSFLMIGSLILNQKLQNQKIAKIEADHCGTCTACIDACPTNAIDPKTRTLIANQCLSTWTIEMMKEEAPIPIGAEKGGGEIFGCDICQDVCPWNIKRESESSIELKDPHQLMNQFLKPDRDTIIQELEKMSQSGFAKKFQQTPLGRTGRRALLRSLHFWKKVRADQNP